jgi:CheY-like chemotaxis protein
VARVLVVEDEDRYREIVTRYLSLCDHDVLDTASGEEAIALGLVHRPQVLVADWMLRRSIHGLHVAEALRTADPALHTVLVTGFPAGDLTIDRQRVGIVELLEKPFDVEALGAAVAQAADAPAGIEAEVIGVIVLDARGGICHRNRAARALLSETRAGADAPGLQELFAPEAYLQIDQAGERWVRVSPEDSQGTVFWVRTRALEGGLRVVAFCAASQEWRRHDARVQMLLGLPLGAAAAAGFSEPVLLVDDSAAICETFVAQLKGRGCVAHAAISHAEALATFRADPEIRVVILDWAMPGEDLRTTVARLREIRPEVRLVGTSGEDRRAEFGELGIEAFLQKPWTVAGELTSLLAGETVRPPVLDS